jgi:tetratricopeptide (TPR) repeat protein
MVALSACFLLAGCQQEAPSTSTQANTGGASATQKNNATAKATRTPEFIGSGSCQDCHADFYKLWSTSWHGLAMQPYTRRLAKELTPQKREVVIGVRKYRADISGTGAVHESGPNGEKTYPIAHVMGGKNVYYFLTSLPRGRLQVLPVAYDVHKKTWYDTAASGVRHFADPRAAHDEALDWTDRMFAFNTSCFDCHVSQLATNYDLASDTYHTTWGEPGISCESCHGPASEHVRVMLSRKKNGDSKSSVAHPCPSVASSAAIKIIRTNDFTAAQMNDMCATCHAKMVPLAPRFVPGYNFFDHYDLITLEHADFYPDGRNLGENYTFTTWLQSPCVHSPSPLAGEGRGEGSHRDKVQNQTLTAGTPHPNPLPQGERGLDCNHCHTPSGRMRYEGREAVKSCLPCHQHEVEHAAEHSHHRAGSPGNDCLACHMPMTRFAAMGQTDHSMRSPAPAASLAFKSPNACNLCHDKNDAAWADSWVRKWYPHDYQTEVLRHGQLIDAARRLQWTRLPEMLKEISDRKGDLVYRNSLVRLLAGCDDERKWPVLVTALRDPAPLVRSSAAAGLVGHLTPGVVDALLTATADESRLVRIRSAAALAAVPSEQIDDAAKRASLARAVEEFNTAMRARPDDWAGYANLGNYALERGDFADAAKYFQTALHLEPRMIGPAVNAAIAYSNLGRSGEAEKCLRQALKQDPANAAVNFNLGLLLGEQGHAQEAQQALRTALKSDPHLAAAAYNLAVLLGEKHLDEAIIWCRKAHDLEPQSAKYTHTLAFFLRAKGDSKEAIELLRKLIRQQPTFWDGYLLLGEILESQHDAHAAADVYHEALGEAELPAELREQLKTKLLELDRGR